MMIKKVRESYRHNIVLMILGPLFKIIEAAFDLMMPLIMKAIIDLNQYGTVDNIPSPVSSAFASSIRTINPTATNLSDAITGGVLILLMGVLGYVITMCSQYMAARVSVNVGTEVRSSLYQQILHLSRKEREQIGDSTLLTLVNSDSYQLQHGILLLVRLAVRAPVILFGSLILSFILDWRVGIAFTIIVPLIMLVNYLVLRKTSKGYVEIQSDLDQVSKQTSESSDGSRVIRASNNQQDESQKFETKTESYKEKSIAVNKVNALLNPLTFAITSIVLIVIILLLQNDLFGPNNIDISSTVIAEMSYLAQIFFVVVQLSQVAVEIVKASVCRRRIDKVLAINPKIINIDNSKKAEISNDYPVIKFNHVSFAFDKNSDSFLNDLCFEIRKGETFGIIGGTGSGKTTVINLIERFYDATEGQILYNNIPLSEYDLKQLRKDIGLVNQKSSLFKGTIKSNYLMSMPNASEDDIYNALQLADAFEFVNKYEDKLDHQVNEGGSNFSGGQKQRLCIGRALIKKPKILVLDDATSALDLLTDKRIRENIRSFNDMTKIIVSQRVSTIQNADYILVLDAGKVVGQGKHDELMKNCDIYREIYETQIRKE